MDRHTVYRLLSCVSVVCVQHNNIIQHSATSHDNIAIINTTHLSWPEAACPPHLPQPVPYRYPKAAMTLLK